MKPTEAVLAVALTPWWLATVTTWGVVAAGLEVQRHLSRR